ncbi:MAG: CobW family GTP-binding protein [Armatimonadota bacterium]
MAIPVIVITGFLGCGKTSFLRRMLPLCGEANVRPALIINEVGDVDVDGELLADLHAEQVRLVGGCVCCTLQSQLKETIYNVIEQKSGDVIIIECSGLSDPLDVLNALSAPALLPEIGVSHIICLLDAGRVLKILNAVELAKSQVSTANIVIMNKADLLDSERWDSIESVVSELSPKSDKYRTNYGDIGKDQFMRILTDPAPTACECGTCCDHEHEHDHDNGHQHHHSLPASFCTTAMVLPDMVSRNDLESFLASIPENVIRAKGFAHIKDEGWTVIQKVYGTANITPLGGPAPKSGAILVCIGQHISPDELHDLCVQKLQ